MGPNVRGRKPAVRGPAAAEPESASASATRPAVAPTVVTTVADLHERIGQARRQDKTIGLVPTMGALHAGHLSLVEASCRDSAYTVVSIFVNPTQFGPSEDFGRYPRNLEADLQALSAYPVDLVFVPTVEEMYPPHSTTVVDVGDVASRWEGACRPGHFRGVATVVLKLLNLVQPNVAYFGQKDYQQTVVVRQMVTDLDVPVTIRVCPTVREPDGLALSSRNVYLSPEDRRRALSLSRGLRRAQELVADGQRSATVIGSAVQDEMTNQNVQIDYVAVVDPATLEAVSTIDGPTVVAVAGRVGTTRLIDNTMLMPLTSDER